MAQPKVVGSLVFTILLHPAEHPNYLGQNCATSTLQEKIGYLGDRCTIWVNVNNNGTALLGKQWQLCHGIDDTAGAND